MNTHIMFSLFYYFWNINKKKNIMDNKYNPNPFDTSTIELTEDLLLLSESLARNVHEVWSKGRIDDGWKYGKTRNDELKTHPSLISYDELSEEEKDYDRRTSQETLKFIIAHGFSIDKK